MADISATPPDPIYSHIDQAYELLWSAKFDDSEAILRKTFDLDSGKATSNMWVQKVYTEVALWRWNFDQDKPSETELVNRLKALVTMAEKLESDNKPGLGWSRRTPEQDRLLLHAYIILGYTNLCDTILLFRKHSIIKGGYYFRKAWTYFRDAEVLLKKDVEANKRVTGLGLFGVGAFHFIVSLIPPQFSFLAKLLGFEGKRETAIRELTSCSKSQSTKAIEAELIIATAEVIFGDVPEDGGKRLYDLKTAHSNSPVLSYMIGFYARWKGDPEGALKLFSTAKDNEALPAQMRVTLAYHTGYSHFLLRQWDKAAELHSYFVKTATARQFVPYARFQQAFSLHKLKRTAEAAETLKQVIPEAKETIQTDVFAKRKALEYQANGGFSELDELIIEAITTQEAKAWESCLTLLKSLRELLKTEAKAVQDSDVSVDVEASKMKIQPDEAWAVYFYLRGTYFSGVGKLDKAESYYIKCLAREKVTRREKFIAPFSHLELATIAFAKNDYDLTTKEIKKAKSYSGFDWGGLLNLKCASLSDRMERRIKHAKKDTTTATE